MIPKLIICHDIYALLPAVLLKRLYRCPVIYDSHKFWPDANPLTEKWQVNFAAFIEGRLIRYADVVITVSPQLARHLENQYGLKEVLSVPNAEPFTSSIAPSCDRPLSSPLQFLLQGHVEELLEAWSQLEDERAILNLRCPENDYLTYLCAKFSRPLEAGRIIILPPVAEEELVSAASSADVGIIPAPGSNLNHVYACPHTLSQYMQAGLAILSHNLEFVSELINHYKCGLVYDTANLGSFVDAVQFLINHPENLQEMKRNAYESAKSEFNWQVQSASYKNSIEHLYTS
jgi:glycosyltransferase involved in cell wall biosynthesis